MCAERWEATLNRVLELTVLLGRDAVDSLAREGLTESRAHLLWQLQQRGPCVQRILAADMHVTPRAITALVDGLVATGFVTREPHPSDRRATLVTFTERGRVTAQALLDGHRRLARQLFAGLPDDTFDGFDAGLLHVLTRLRGVVAAKRAPNETMTDGTSGRLDGLSAQGSSTAAHSQASSLSQISLEGNRATLSVTALDPVAC